MEINLSNAEKLIFYDSEVQKLLSSHNFIVFEQWKLGKRVPSLRRLSKQAIIDLLNSLTEDDVSVLETYFGEDIVVKKVVSQISHSIIVSIKENICDKLCEIRGFDYYDVCRDENYIYISFWRS